MNGYKHAGYNGKKLQSNKAGVGQRTGNRVDRACLVGSMRDRMHCGLCSDSGGPTETRFKVRQENLFGGYDTLEFKKEKKR